MQEYVQPGAVLVLAAGLRVGYKHIMAALERGRARDDALAKRLLSYEHTSNERHTEVVQRLTHVEALVDGKGDG